MVCLVLFTGEQEIGMLKLNGHIHMHVSKQIMPSYPQSANKWKFATAFNNPHNKLTAPDTVKYTHFPNKVKKTQNPKICIYSKAHVPKYSQTHDTHRGDHPKWVI